MIIWLASYPKSGNTWLRALLSSYLYSQDGKFDFDLLYKIDSFPSERFFKNYPDKFERPEDTAKYWLTEQEKINQSKNITFFKTHNALCKINENRFTNSENTLGAIYIIRDPRNIITSIAHHYQISKEDALNFMMDEKKGIFSKVDNRYIAFQLLFSWILNQKSWVENKNFPVLTIRYEDLQSETFTTFKKVLDFINNLTNSKKSIDRDKAKEAIRNCDFEKLKKLEKDKGFAESITKKGSDEKIPFFNLGTDNNYKNLLDSKLLNKMNELFQTELVKYNYE
tara:strand:- start:367 stop:1212 length:846 start_codon:yes stop_codon:yes gene_type:complete